jgi:hypothetical protein
MKCGRRSEVFAIFNDHNVFVFDIYLKKELWRTRLINEREINKICEVELRYSEVGENKFQLEAALQLNSGNIAIVDH